MILRRFSAAGGTAAFLPHLSDMPRFFFDTSDGERTVIDEIGMDLPDADAARRAALDALPDIARDVMPDGDRRQMSVTVRRNRLAIYVAALELKGDWLVEASASGEEAER